MRTAATPSLVSAPPRATLAEHDAAIYLGMSPAFLRKQRRLGRPPGYSRLGRRIVYLRADLDALLDATRVDPSARRARA